MKNRNDVFKNQRSAVYAVLYNDFRNAALDCGYALAVHGSMLNDMDLIAVAWTEESKPHPELVKAISDCIGDTIWKEYHFKQYEVRPHGRIVYTLSIYGDWRIDLSVIPPK
ncbi:MAG: hypothetical protein WEA58_04085 [Balneolaceae bacterium]